MHMHPHVIALVVYLVNQIWNKFICLFNNTNGWCLFWFTWACIYACNHNGHHLVTFESDIDIFDAILAPMCGGNFLVTCESVTHTTNLADDDEPIWKVVKRSCINK